MRGNKKSDFRTQSQKIYGSAKKPRCLLRGLRNVNLKGKTPLPQSTRTRLPATVLNNRWFSVHLIKSLIRRQIPKNSKFVTSHLIFTNDRNKSVFKLVLWSDGWFWVYPKRNIRYPEREKVYPQRNIEDNIWEKVHPERNIEDNMWQKVHPERNIVFNIWEIVFNIWEKVYPQRNI
jgi:hypothetical protein